MHIISRTAVCATIILTGVLAPLASEATGSITDNVYEDVASCTGTANFCLVTFSSANQGLIINQVSCNFVISGTGRLNQFRLGDVNRRGIFRPNGSYLGWTSSSSAGGTTTYQFLFNTLAPYVAGSQPGIQFFYTPAFPSKATCTISATPHS